MADIPMKSIQWPGLPDRYTFLQKASTLTDSDAGKAADASVVGEALGQLQEAYQDADGVLDQRIDQLEAEIDTDSGEAPTLVAGTAEQLLSTTGVQNPTPYTYRENASGSDRVTVRQITGGTVAWNQLASFNAGTSTNKGITATANADGTVSFSGTATENYAFYAMTPRRENIYSHVIMLWGCPSGGSTTGYRFQDGYSSSSSMDTGSGKIYKTTNASGYTNAQVSISSGTTVENVVFKPQYCDLTQMFGSAVADYIYGLETATPGAGVALFRTMFPESYYPYNTGELVSVQTSGRKTVGFNKWDGEYEADKWIANDGTYAIQTGHAGYNVTSYIPVIGGGRYYHSVTGSGRFLFYDSSKAPIPGTDWDRITGANAAAFTAPVGAAYMRATVRNEYLLSFIVNISDPSRDGTYEPYSAHTYPLDSTLTLRGVPVLTDGVPAYDGDKYAPTGAVTRRYGIVDLGTLTWTRNNTNGEGVNQYKYVTSSLASSIRTANNNANLTTWIIVSVGNLSPNSANNVHRGINGTIAVDASGNIQISDGFTGTYSEFKDHISGVYLVYELATPTTETAAPYQEIQIAGSTEEFLNSPIPVGSVSLYQTNLREGLETLLDTDLAHAESIAPVQGGTASTNIASGELLMRDGKLYTATQAIVAGAEIGATNTTATTIAAQLAALEARIAALEN